LQAAAEGQALRPVERAHLRACAACTAEAEALAGLMRALQDAPEPPRALAAAVLQRLGLAPQPRRAWRWAPVGLGLGLAAACALWLTLAPTRRCPLPPAAAAVADRPARCASAKAAPRPAPQPAPAAASVPVQAAAAPAQGWLEAPAREAAAPALGSLAPTPPPTRPPQSVSSLKGPDTDPGPAPLVASVRNNLLKPGSGPLIVRLQLDQAGPLDARVFSQQGRPVAELYHGAASAGSTVLQWDAAGAANGPYTLVIRAQARTQTVKILVVR
jgi:hypothetical protein